MIQSFAFKLASSGLYSILTFDWNIEITMIEPLINGAQPGCISVPLRKYDMAIRSELLFSLILLKELTIQDQKWFDII